MNPVVYARLPGAQHSFDLLHSVRFHHVIDGIEAFTAWVRARRDPPSAQLTTASPPSHTPMRTLEGAACGRSWPRDTPNVD